MLSSYNAANLQIVLQRKWSANGFTTQVVCKSFYNVASLRIEIKSLRIIDLLTLRHLVIATFQVSTSKWSWIWLYNISNPLLRWKISWDSYSRSSKFGFLHKYEHQGCQIFSSSNRKSDVPISSKITCLVFFHECVVLWCLVSVERSRRIEFDKNKGEVFWTL